MGRLVGRKILSFLDQFSILKDLARCLLRVVGGISVGDTDIKDGSGAKVSKTVDTNVTSEFWRGGTSASWAWWGNWLIVGD